MARNDMSTRTRNFLGKRVLTVEIKGRGLCDCIVGAAKRRALSPRREFLSTAAAAFPGNHPEDGSSCRTNHRPPYIKSLPRRIRSSPQRSIWNGGAIVQTILWVAITSHPPQTNPTPISGWVSSKKEKILPKNVFFFRPPARIERLRKGFCKRRQSSSTYWDGGFGQGGRA